MLGTGEGAGADGGATLLEVLVVLAILGLAVGIGFPRLQYAHLRLASEAARDEVAADLRSARALAIRSGRPVTVEISDHGGALAWGDHLDRLPDNARIAAEISPVRFSPAGATAANRLALSSRGRSWPGIALHADNGAIIYQH